MYVVSDISCDGCNKPCSQLFERAHDSLKRSRLRLSMAAVLILCPQRTSKGPAPTFNASEDGTAAACTLLQHPKHVKAAARVLRRKLHVERYPGSVVDSIPCRVQQGPIPELYMPLASPSVSLQYQKYAADTTVSFRSPHRVSREAANGLWARCSFLCRSGLRFSTFDLFTQVIASTSADIRAIFSAQFPSRHALRGALQIETWSKPTGPICSVAGGEQSNFRGKP